MNKTTISRRYFPHATPQSALRMFNRYLHRAKGLLDELYRAYYRPDDRHLTPRQVQIIYAYLGEPFDDSLEDL